jgi:DNA-binding NtrC family response regulator
LLPYEKEASGTAALVFEDCETKKTVSPYYDYYNRYKSSNNNLPVGCNNVIVLYHNGTYLKMDSIYLRPHVNILMDMNYVRGETSGQQGLDLISKIKQTDDTISIIVMTAWGSVELAVEAMRRGAQDFIPKPWKNERLMSILHTQLELGRALRKSRQLEQEIDYLKDENRHMLIAQSPAMRPVLETIAKVGPSDANVLITGENGTGKGVIAQALYAASNRKEKTLVSINTASIPETIFESELFGHVAGAFTDAKSDRLGRFQLADGGTLFMDEIATIPINLQPKLLRVLENGEFEPIGSSKTCHVDVRVLSATNAILDEEVDKGNFRQDLLYRLNTVYIHIPPLRDRREDIPLLARHFLQKYVVKYRKSITDYDASCMQLLLNNPWPGNVRELDHTIERAVLMAQNDLVYPGDLGLQTNSSPTQCFEEMTLEELELWAIKNALRQHQGDVSKAANALKLSRGALYRRMEKYEIQ